MRILQFGIVLPSLPLLVFVLFGTRSHLAATGLTAHPPSVLSSESTKRPDYRLGIAEAFAAELKRCSPSASSNDMEARDRASEALRSSAVLRRAMRDTILWGGRPDNATTYDPKPYNLTMFSSYAYTAMYLSLFTFHGEHTVTESGGYTILHIPCDFRSAMDTGAYPYPFWHKPAKWNDYQSCKNIDFVFEKGKLLAAYRSIEKKPEVQLVAHEFDGRWTWTSPDGKPMPSVALYDYLLSPQNPHREALDRAYRDFALESRRYRCLECHSPANPSMMSKLSMLNYPNQALGARHDLLKDIQNGTMPPGTGDQPAGIADAKDRRKMLDIARRFADLGDKALRFESQHRADARP